MARARRWGKEDDRKSRNAWRPLHEISEKGVFSLPGFVIATDSFQTLILSFRRGDTVLSIYQANVLIQYKTGNNIRGTTTSADVATWLGAVLHSSDCNPDDLIGRGPLLLTHYPHVRSLCSQAPVRPRHECSASHPSEWTTLSRPSTRNRAGSPYRVRRPYLISELALHGVCLE